MSIKFFTSASTGLNINVPPELIPEFIQMVERATNTWQDKSKSIADFRNKLVAIKRDLIAESRITKKDKELLSKQVEATLEADKKARLEKRHNCMTYCHPETCNCWDN